MLSTKWSGSILCTLSRQKNAMQIPHIKSFSSVSTDHPHPSQSIHSNSTVAVSYVTAGHQIKGRAGVCKMVRLCKTFCLHCRPHSEASLLTSLTLVTSLHEYSLEQSIQSSFQSKYVTLSGYSKLLSQRKKDKEELTVCGSLLTETVRPAALLPFPDVYTCQDSKWTSSLNIYISDLSPGLITLYVVHQ